MSVRRSEFHRLWKSFQAIWKAMNVLPVPVASVSRMRVMSSRDGLHDPRDGDVLVVPRLEIAAPILERYGSEAVSPLVRFGKGHVPKFIWRGEGGNSPSVPSSMSMP